MMEEDHTISIPHLYWESARPAIPGEGLFLAGMVSLALHGLVILLVIAAGSLLSLPEKMEPSPELKVTLVTFSPASPSQAQTSRVTEKDPKDPARENRKDTLSMRTLPENPAAGGQAPESKAQKKSGETLFYPGPLETKERAKEEKTSPPAGADMQLKGKGISSTSSEAKGNGQGKEAASSSHGIQKNGGTVGEIGGTSTLTVSRYRHTPPPIYPQAARQKGYEGLVMISVEILENGTPGQLLVKKSSGYAILDQAALSAVRKWKFVPAEQNDLQIRSWGNVPIRFVLQDGS